MELSLFAYRGGRGPLHRLPAWLKLAAMAACTALFFRLGPIGCAASSVAAIALLRAHGFGFAETARSLRPLASYAAVLYSAAVLSNSLQAQGTEVTAAALLAPPEETVRLMCRLAAALLASSAVFRTTTPLQLTEGAADIERALRRILRAFPPLRRNVLPEAGLAGPVAAVIAFIPRVLKAWEQLDTAWRGRGGKNGIRKMRTLIPALFSVCMEEAARSARAMQSRKPSPSGCA